MGIRETINKNPAMGVGLSVAGILLAVGLAIFLQRPTKPPAPYGVFFTTDDGKTTFAGDITMLPPFDHQGREAVRVYMYQSPDGGEPFAGFLEKFTPEARQRLAAAASDDERSQAMEAIGSRGILIKAPGAAEWVPRSSAGAREILEVKDSNGRHAEPVLPPQD